MLQFISLVPYFTPTVLCTITVSLFLIVLLFKYFEYKKSMKGLEPFKSSKKFIHERNLALTVFGKKEALKSLISSYADQFQSKGYFAGITFVGRYVVVGRYDRVEELVRDTQILDKSFAFDFTIPFFGEGIIVSKGKKWKERRQFVRPIFMGSSLAKSNESIYRISNEIIDKVIKSQNEKLDLRGFFSNFTMTMILDKSLGVVLPNEDVSFLVCAMDSFINNSMIRGAIPIFYFDTIYKLYLKISGLQRKIDSFNNILREAIRKKLQEMQEKQHATRREEIPNDSQPLTSSPILSELFLHKYHSNLDEPISSTLEEAMLEEMKSIISAGSGGPDNMLTWFVYILGLYPDIQDKIHDEIEDTDPSKWTLKTVNSWKYLDQCFKESTRLYTAVPFMTRSTEKDEKFDGHVVPKGTTILVLLFNLLRDETIFPESDQFKPERFHPDAVPKIPTGAYIPFGVRPRDCIGDQLTAFYIKFIVARIIKQFQIESKKHFNDVHSHFNYTVLPSEPLLVKFTKRC